MQCPCHPQHLFADCCAPYLEQGVEPPTPLALMRARYSAFVLGHEAFLLHTWHPATRGELTVAELTQSSKNTQWLGLTILFAQGHADDLQGTVEFKVRYKEHTKVHLLHERSHFERVAGFWKYHSGQHNPPKIKINALCPCLSGKKYKLCCAKRFT